MSTETARQVASLAYRSGFCVVPPKEDGTKAPETEVVTRDQLTALLGAEQANHILKGRERAATWKHWQIVRPSPEQERAWYANGRSGVGIITGAISGNAELFEFDDFETYEAYKATAKSSGLGDVVERLETGYVEYTPRGGVHWLYRCQQIAGNTELARRPNGTIPDGSPKIDVLIETRGQGGYAVLAPSNGRVHPEGKPYRLLRGSIDTIAAITPEERRALWELAASFDEMPKSEYRRSQQQTSMHVNGTRPGDDFDRRADWPSLLEPHGWQFVAARDDTEYWRRPGKHFGVSATINGPGVNPDRLYVFSSSTVFESRRSYSKFQAYALLNHQGDFAAAARELAERGYGASGDDLRPLAKHEHGEPAPPEPDWRDRQPLPQATPSVPALPATLIPEPLRPWLTDAAARASLPLEFVTIPALVALGAVVGRSIGIRPGRYDDYTVVPNLWGAPIARPGAMKSSAIAEGMRPLKQLAASARERFAVELDRSNAKTDRIKAEIAAIKQQMTAVAKKGGSLGPLEAQLSQKNAELRDAQVTERRYFTQDATVEKLGELLRENPRGLLISRDELAGWLRTLDKPGREGDREFFLESWNGDGSFTVDRIGRGTVHIDAVTISILGGIQPGKLSRYIRDAIGEGSGADGMLQRIQLLVWPDGLGDWSPTETWPDRTAKQTAYELYRLIDELTPAASGATCEEGSIPYLRFAPDAQQLYDQWRDELEHRLRSNELASTPAFESHLAKYRSLMPALALLFHLLDIVSQRETGGVSLASARRAAAWCEFLELHARKVYHPEVNAGVDAAHALVKKIASGAVIDGHPVRDIYRAQWSGLATSDRVYAALDLLSDLGWLRLETRATNGRPSEVVRLHPDLGGETDD